MKHAKLRASVITTRDAMRVVRRKCLTFAHECVSMLVMDDSNAAVARGEKGSLTRFGALHRNPRNAFRGRNMQTAKAIEIAASKDMKFTACAGFVPAVS